jgi:hypothetical protein
MSVLFPSVLLVLAYSPQSQYFVGPVYVQQPNVERCMEEASRRLGSELQTLIAWDTHMAGPVPKVVAAYCVDGVIKKNGAQ